MFIRESNSLYVKHKVPAMTVDNASNMDINSSKKTLNTARSNQTAHFQDGRPRLISPVQYLTKWEISSQS